MAGTCQAQWLRRGNLSICLLSMLVHMRKLQPCRVPEECPAWVAELITACRSESAAERPTSKEIYRMLLEEEDA